MFVCLFATPACRILAPLPGIEPGPSAVKERSPNYWTAREFPCLLDLEFFNDEREREKHFSGMMRPKASFIGLGEPIHKHLSVLE